MRTLLEIAAREHEVTPEALEKYRAENHEKAEKARVRDGVGILDVAGPLFKRANLMTAYCGATSYDVLMRDFASLVDDQNVRAILLNVDSPGGEASGCGEFAAAVLAARGSKPIVAYAGDLAASAAYWIASAADRIVIGPGAAVGSVGVRASITDTSARDARAGVARFAFVSSQSPHKVSDPKTDDGTARIQARVDALAAVFVEAVASNRDTSTAHVLDAFGKGDVKIGAAALAAGMADGLGTFESVLAELSASTDPLAGLALSTAAPRGPQPREVASMPTTAAAAEAARAAVVAAQTAERERVAGICTATYPGYEADRDEAVRTGMSAAVFRDMVVDREHARIAEPHRAAESILSALGLTRLDTPARPLTTASVSDDERAAVLMLDAWRTCEPAERGRSDADRQRTPDDPAVAAILSAVHSARTQ